IGAGQAKNRIPTRTSAMHKRVSSSLSRGVWQPRAEKGPEGPRPFLHLRVDGDSTCVGDEVVYADVMASRWDIVSCGWPRACDPLVRPRHLAKAVNPDTRVASTPFLSSIARLPSLDNVFSQRQESGWANMNGLTLASLHKYWPTSPPTHDSRKKGILEPPAHHTWICAFRNPGSLHWSPIHRLARSAHFLGALLESFWIWTALASLDQDQSGRLHCDSCTPHSSTLTRHSTSAQPVANMVRTAFSAALAAAALVRTAYAAGAKCTKDSHCPQDTPCCSLYGDCGVGAFCLGGCDPLMSHSFDSCVPGPVCKSGTYTLDSLDDVQTIDKYLGDASKINWQSQGMPAIYTDPNGKKSTLLTMAQGTVGTLLASTHYVWYGKICSKLSTAQGKGVVTAFILMSDVKDEIDFEWVGVDTGHVQSNFYSQDTNGKNLTVPDQDTASTMHEYCIDWTTDSLTWSINGKDQRTLNRKDTWNATSNRFDYPQTPARIMLSLWPAGLPTNEKGTIEWAGGEIDWNSPYMENGYYYARFSEVTVECYDPPPNAQKKGSKTYKYTDEAGTNNTVAITDDEVILGSLMGTGENPGEPPKSGDAQPTNSIAMVPGGNPGAGAANQVEQTPAADQAAGGAGANPAQQTGGATQGGDVQTGFTQGGSSVATGSAPEGGLNRLGGSVVAVVVAILALVAM
ncbi:hypothetical protein IAQ61_010732, partial [Plenodomus lingam]|uniref:uncharacterized protein n=1 Tax=Leptosphaeria maculans TaxID=5022 RepID=UPI003323B83D